MKRYVITTTVVVAAHLALVLWPPYFRLLADCGTMVSHGNDLADVPRQGLLGAVIVGLVLIAVANGVAVWWRPSGALHE